MTRPARRVPDIRYGEVLGYRPLELDLYLPPVDGPAPADGAAPVVVYVHGGGWQRGTRRDPPLDRVPARASLSGLLASGLGPFLRSSCPVDPH